VSAVLESARRGGLVSAVISILALLVNAALLAVWVFVITPAWVRIAADAYAERLLESIDTLSS
jgi:hypothetical protein